MRETPERQLRGDLEKGRGRGKRWDPKDREARSWRGLVCYPEESEFYVTAES